MKQPVVHRALDGSRVSLSGDGDLTQPFTSVMRVAIDGRIYELTCGDHTAAKAWARDIGVKRLDEEFSVQGGRLRTGYAVTKAAVVGTERVLVASWEGRRYAVFTDLYHATPADAVRLFDALKMTEHADGISITPRRGKRAAIAEPPSVVKEVPGVGLLEITGLNRQTARRLPPWPGTKLPSGELFRDYLEDEIYFVLSTPTAIVTVLPLEPSRLREAPDRLSRLNVEVFR